MVKSSTRFAHGTFKQEDTEDHRLHRCQHPEVMQTRQELQKAEQWSDVLK